MGGRGSGTSMGGEGAKKNPSAAPIGTKLTLGGWKYTKVQDNKWRSFFNGERRNDRSDADIKWVFK